MTLMNNDVDDEGSPGSLIESHLADQDRVLR